MNRENRYFEFLTEDLHKLRTEYVEHAASVEETAVEMQNSDVIILILERHIALIDNVLATR